MKLCTLVLAKASWIWISSKCQCFKLNTGHIDAVWQCEQCIEDDDWVRYWPCDHKRERQTPHYTTNYLDWFIGDAITRLGVTYARIRPVTAWSGTPSAGVNMVKIQFEGVTKDFSDFPADIAEPMEFPTTYVEAGKFEFQINADLQGPSHHVLPF